MLQNKTCRAEAAPETPNNIIRGNTDIMVSRNLEIRTATTKVLRTIRSAQKLHNLLMTIKLELK
jgi:hypothetical protein